MNRENNHEIQPSTEEISLLSMLPPEQSSWRTRCFEVFEELQRLRRDCDEKESIIREEVKARREQIHKKYKEAFQTLYEKMDRATKHEQVAAFINSRHEFLEKCRSLHHQSESRIQQLRNSLTSMYQEEEQNAQRCIPEYLIRKSQLELDKLQLEQESKTAFNESRKTKQELVRTRALMFELSEQAHKTDEKHQRDLTALRRDIAKLRKRHDSLIQSSLTIKQMNAKKYEAMKAAYEEEVQMIENHLLSKIKNLAADASA